MSDEKKARPAGTEHLNSGRYGTSRTFGWKIAGRTLSWGERPLIMGIVNVTPDSFSDGGLYLDPGAAVAHGLHLARQGADILDVGGESTRPGATPVPPQEETRRVLPVIAALAKKTNVAISVDTSKAVVARACLVAGAAIVNDVTALTGDAEMPATVRDFGAGVVLMHMQGTPSTMQLAPHYADVVADISLFLEEQVKAAANAGIDAEQTVIDPGIGFGKTSAHNLEILMRLAEFQRLGRPLCLGISRKGLINKLVGERGMERRLAGGLAILCHAMGKRAVQIVRVHDVEETKDAVTVFEKLTMA